MTTFGRVETPWWNDGTTYLVGGGPSLRGFDFRCLDGLRSVGVNQSMFDLTRPAAGISIDQAFVRNNAKRLETFAAEAPLYLVTGNSAKLEPVAGAIYLHDDYLRAV